MPTAAAPRRQAVHAGFDTERLEPRVLLDATLGLDSTDLLVRPSGRNASPLVLVPTDEVPQEIEIVNRSTRSVASGVLSVQFLLSRDRILGDDVLVADAVRTVLLRPGESTFVELELNPPADIARGEYFLIALARPTEGSSIIDPELGNNTRVLPGVRTVVWQFGRVGTRQNISLSIDLGDNKGATFFINDGPGTGVVTQTAQGLVVQLQNTNQSSRVFARTFAINTTRGNIVPPPQVDLRRVVSNTPLERIELSNFDVRQSLIFRAGISIVSTDATNFGPGSAIVLTGGNAVTGDPSIVLLGEITGLRLQSDRRLRTLAFNPFTVVTPERGLSTVSGVRVTAPAITELVAGTFTSVSFDRFVLTGASDGRPTLARMVVSTVSTTAPARISGNVGTMIADSFQNFQAEVTGRIGLFEAAVDVTNSLVTARRFGSITVNSNLTSSTFAAGGFITTAGTPRLGLGGPGSIASLSVGGDVVDSNILAGARYQSLGPPPTFRAPALVNIPSSTIGRIAISGVANASTRFVAGSFTDEIEINSANITPAGDPRFIIPA
jgi:hypothetical protein